MKIQLTLSSNTNSLDFELYEAVSLDDINALINSDLLKETLCVYNNEYYPNERTLLKAYKALHTKNGVKTKWAKAKSKWGRAFPVNSLSLTTMPRNLRETLMKNHYYITDLKNAQPCILLNICKAYKIKCESLEEYCEDRDKHLKEIMEFYNVDRYLAKKLVLNIGFGGEVGSWVEEWNGQVWKGNKYEMKNTTKTMTFLRIYIAEMKTICEELISKNSALYKSCYDKHKPDANKIRRSFFATYCQEQEFQIVYQVFKYLYNETDLMDLNGVKVGVYEYDGINLPLKDDVEPFEVCRLLKQKTFELTGFVLDWDIKDMDDYEDISKWQGVVSNEEATFATLLENCEILFDKLNSTGVIEAVEEMAPAHYIFKVEHKGGGTWYCWDEEKNRWVNNSHPLRKCIVYRLCNKWLEEIKTYQGILKELELSSAESKQITNMLGKITDFCKKSLKDDTICNKCIHHAESLMEGDIDFDNSSLLFGCNNGVLDIEKGVFRPYTFEDKMTYTCGYDFVPIAKGVSYINPASGRKATIMGETAENSIILTDISGVILQIMPLETHRELLFMILASTLIGKTLEKFIIFNGKGRNGKGLIDEFMAVVLGKDYFVTITPNIFTEDTSKKQTANANPELAKLDNKRMVLASEFSESAKLNNDFIKALTGGNELSARKLYSNDSVVRNRGTYLIECNVKPDMLHEPGQADAERMIDFLFGSYFTADETKHNSAKHIYPVRPELKTPEWKDIHKNAMLNILFLYAIKFKQNNYQIDKYIPDDIKERSQDYLQNSKPIYKIFRKLYEYKGSKSYEGYEYNKNEDLTIPKIVAKISKSNTLLSLSKQIQEKYDSASKIKEWIMEDEFFKNKIETDNKQKFLRGWREIPPENCEDE